MTHKYQDSFDKKKEKHDKDLSEEKNWSEKKKSIRLRSEALRKIIDFYKKNI